MATLICNLYSFNKANPLAGDAKLERQLESGDYEVFSPTL